MARYIKTLFILAAALALASCEEIPSFEKKKEIRLYARYANGSLETRASDTTYVYHTMSTSPVRIGLARVDQADGQYPSFNNCGTAHTATMEAPDADGYREIHFDKAQFFANSSDYIKYAGWGPWETGMQGYSSSTGATTVAYDIDGATDVMYGSVVTGKETQDFGTMYFNHALSEVRIWVYQTLAVDENGNVVQTSDEWGQVESISLEGMTSNCTLTLPKTDAGLWEVSYGSQTRDLVFNNESPMYFNPGDIPASYDQKRKVGVALIAPPKGNMLNIRFKTSGISESRLVTIAKDFRPGYAYDVILRFTQFGIIEGAVTVAEWSGQEGEYTDVYINQGVKVYNNLSRYGTANCYIVSSGNFLYGFDCKVKGNGNADLVNESNTSLDVNHLEILWKDPSIPDKVKDKDGNDVDFIKLSPKPSDNLAKFEVAGNANTNDHTLTHEGNIVIGGYDQEGGTLLWTWHIWLSKKVDAEGNGKGYNILDRNLGATSTNKTGGLKYQWGRMTPLRDGAGISAVQAASISEAIRSYDTAYGTSSNNWLGNSTEALGTLWGYQNDFTEVQKTIYDPCPLGYVVADTQVWADASFTGDSWTSTSTYADLSRSYGYSGIKGAYTYKDDKRSDLKTVRCIAEGKEARYVKNLSEAQTANCYIVSENGYYKFNVLTRGNGISSLVPVGGNGRVWDLNHGLPATIQRSAIDVVKPRWWQGDFLNYTTWNNISEPSTATLNPLMGGIKFLQKDGVTWSEDSAQVDDEGYITFQITDWKPGNLLLAAYTGNEVLWSWHIWLTEEPQNVGFGNYAVLDRNLGATFTFTDTGTLQSLYSNVYRRWATYGLFYQWGRKDPIIHEELVENSNAGSLSNNGSKASSAVWYFNDPAAGWTRRTNIDVSGQNSSMSMDNARLYPETFFKASASNGENSTWFLKEYAATTDRSSTALWGYAVYSTAQGKSFTKTINDPCPPGYRTMNHNTLFTDNGESGTETNITNYTGTHDGIAYVVNNAVFGSLVSKGGGGMVFWPHAGQRDNTGKTGGQYYAGYYATGMPMGQYNVRSGEFRRDRNNYYSAQRTGTYGTSTAMSVRCMKE